MDMKKDITLRLGEMIADYEEHLPPGQNPEKITLIQARREIVKLRAAVEFLTQYRDTEESTPQYAVRATRVFTPREAADFLEEAMGEELRHTPDEAEALHTLFALARRKRSEASRYDFAT